MSGQLGHGSNLRSSTPQQIKSLTDISSISCGGNHSIAINKKGKMFSWGRNEHGQLGNGNYQSYDVPQEINFKSHLVSQVSCGIYHTVVLTQEGKIFTFGSNGFTYLREQNVDINYSSPIEMFLL